MRFLKQLFGKTSPKQELMSWQDIVKHVHTEILSNTDVEANIEWGNDLDNTRIAIIEKGDNDEGQQSLFFGNFYHQYQQNPNNLENLTADYIKLIKNRSTDGKLEDAETEQIMPVLKSKDWCDGTLEFIKSESENNDKAISNAPIMMGLVNDINVCFVIDNEQSMAYVTNDLLEKWEIDQDTLKTLALENLKRLMPGVQVDGDGRYILTYDQCYDASFALLAADFAQKLNIERPVFTIPERGTFAMCNIDDIEGIMLLQRLAQQSFEESTYEISAGLFTLGDNGKWQGVELEQTDD